MRLSELFRGSGTDVGAAADAEIAGIAYDSRKVAPGDAFFALPGFNSDGAAHAAEAIGRGAAAVIAEKTVALPSVPFVLVSDARLALAIAASNFNGRPARTMKLVGITGTNGKTTTSYLVESIAADGGAACGVVGTVEYRYGGRTFEATHTTPEAPELAMLLKDMRDAGVGTAVLEVSSHALAMRRVEGLSFDVVAFSNLTRDHLDYHGSMESYFASKARLFRPFPLDVKDTTAVINVDDHYGRVLAGEARFRTVAVSGTAGGGADVFPVWSDISLDGISAELCTPSGKVQVRSPLVGRHNLMNIVLAAGIANALGLTPGAIEAGIGKMLRVPGRLERVPNDAGITCLVDYAHTDDALKNVLGTLREIVPGRIITVFGCGGDRDRGKRPLMGLAASSLSDIAVVTSDNPRTENAEEIIADIMPGVESSGKPRLSKEQLASSAAGYAVEPDRRTAIAAAVSAAAGGDVVLLAGKGHEDYQIVGRQKLHFDDREEAAAVLAARAKRTHAKGNGAREC